MIRQYIGARYVPIFDGEWTSTKAYEPLTIVTSLGNSYTSKTFVPVGTDINDERYWILTGNYNAQVEQYRREVADLREEIVEINSFLFVGAKCKFKTINSAIQYAREHNAGSRTVIYISSGVYFEEIDLNDNFGVDLIGVPDQTIIISSSNYPNATIQTTGRGSFYGITFRNQGGVNAYALHYEIQTTPTVEGETTFTECKFVSDASSAVGCGLGKNNSLIFKNCEFVGIGKAAFYCHNYPLDGAIGQFVRCFNCRFFALNYENAIIIDDATTVFGAGGSSPMDITFNGCFVANGKFLFRKTSENTYNYIPRSENNIFLNVASNYNTLHAMNYDSSDIVCSYGYIKPLEKIPNTDYYEMFIPFDNADKYDITLADATIQGIGTLDISNFSIVNKVINGFTLRDTNENGTGDYITILFRCI